MRDRVGHKHPCARKDSPDICHLCLSFLNLCSWVACLGTLPYILFPIPLAMERIGTLHVRFSREDLFYKISLNFSEVPLPICWSSVHSDGCAKINLLNYNNKFIFITTFCFVLWGNQGIKSNRYQILFISINIHRIIGTWIFAKESYWTRASSMTMNLIPNIMSPSL